MRLPIERARAFLATRRFAVVGVSRNEKDFSRYLLRELLARGYDAVPVNPADRIYFDHHATTPVTAAVNPFGGEKYSGGVIDLTPTSAPPTPF